MVSDTAHHISKLNKYVSLQTTHGIKEPEYFFPSSFITSIQKLHSQLQTEQQLCLTYETQELALIKVKKKEKQNKKHFTKKKMITVSRCDQNIHWQHKYLDCITILCS